MFVDGLEKSIIVISIFCLCVWEKDISLFTLIKVYYIQLTGYLEFDGIMENIRGTTKIPEV